MDDPHLSIAERRTVYDINKFIEQGFVLFPLAPMSKQPPIGTSGHLSWESEDTNDVIDLLTDGEHNVAIQTGARSGCVVVDIDPRHGGSRERVVEIFETEIDTREHATANSGTHLFFAYPEGVEYIPSVSGKLGPGIDVKADGGYVVAPPSRLATGEYTVVSEAALMPLPDKIRALLVPLKREKIESHYQYPEGWWDSVLRWHQQNVREANNAGEGERDDCVYRMLVRSMQLAFTVPDSVLTCDKVIEDFSKGVEYYIKGLSGKSERARVFAELNPRPHPSVDVTASSNDEEDWTLIHDYVGMSDRLSRDKLNDIANAKRIEELLIDRVRFVVGEGWYVWTGKVWMHEGKDSEGITEIVSNANKLLYLDLAAAELIAPATKDQMHYVARMNNMTGVRATVEKLQATRALRVDVDQLDRQAHLLAVNNGTVDLRTGLLLDHDPNHLLTRLIPFDYSVDAPCARWERFLSEVMPSNPELVSFLQRLVGYGITGEISEHAMVIHYGRGRNGKSVFLDALAHVFGPISSVADWRSFAQQQSGGGSARSDIARLRGARFVTVNEGDARTRLDEAQIKRMVSGDPLTARHLYQAEIEFAPTFLLQMATNAKPDFRGADEGLWNRVKLIPWLRYFEPHERDHSLTDVLRSEAQGILSWAVRGAVEWYASGLREPDVIREATQDYRDSADELGGFVGDLEHGGWLVRQEGGKVPSSWMLGLYKVWAEAQNYTAQDMLNARTLKAAMEERGFAVKRSSNGNIYSGLAVNMDIPAVAQAAASIRDASKLTRAGAVEEAEAVVRSLF